MKRPEPTRVPRRFTLDGLRSNGTSGRSTQRPVFSVAMRTASLSVVPSTVITSPSKRPPAAVPRAMVRSRSSDEPLSGTARSVTTSRSRSPSRRKGGTSFDTPPIQTLPRRSTSGAARGAVTLPAIRPDPSAAMRPLTRALAPATSTMSRLSTKSVGPSERMRAAILPAPRLLPAAHVARIEDEADVDILGRVEDTRYLRQLLDIEVCAPRPALRAGRAPRLGGGIARIPGQGRVAGLDADVAEGKHRQVEHEIGRRLEGSTVQNASGRDRSARERSR